jgi:CRISPR-associated protein Cas1
MLPFHGHHRQADVARLQIEASVPLRKRLWQRIAQSKIANQEAALLACGKGSSPLAAMAALVGSGDPDNVEARAAREYWKRIFTDFTRDNERDRRNGLLNYGYAVTRAGVARALVASGLLPCLGLHHASTANAFNLADDLVEPFRPFVDRVVFQLSDGGTRAAGEAGIEDRRALAGVLLEEAAMNEDRVTLLVAAEQAAASLVRALEAGTPAVLSLPRLIA